MARTTISKFLTMYNFPRLLSEKNMMTKVSFIFLGVIIMACLYVAVSVMLVSLGQSPYTTFLLQTLMALFIFFFPALTFAYFFHNHGETTFGYLSQNRLPSLSLVALGVGAILLAIPFINWLSDVNKMVYPEDKAMLAKLVELLTGGDCSLLFLRLVVVAFLPALTEEMFFRGLLQNTLARTIGSAPAVCVAALIFSLAHNDLSGALPRFLLGCFLGYLLVRSGSLWLPTLVHFINNGIIVTCYYFFYNAETGDCFIDRWGSDSVLCALLSAVAVVGCVCLIKRNANQEIGRPDVINQSKDC